MPHLHGRLSLSALSLQGWANSRPSEHHGVCPEMVAYAIAAELIRHGTPHAGIGILLLFDGYLRIGDLLQLKLADVVFLEFSTKRSHYGTMNITLGKRGRNEAVTIRPYFLVFMLKRLTERRILFGENLLFPFASARFRAILRRSVERLSLPFAVTPHMLRFGGATTDKLFGRLSDQEIKSRGRWQSDQNFKLYIHSDKLYATLNALSTEQRQNFEPVVTNAQSLFNVPVPIWAGGLEENQVPS
ncbi:DNA breaking-rejoining enzyme [Gracilaria domingensis]|nr:DNA breaking-rejoining enzyme [Gracilaria domingensis]